VTVEDVEAFLDARAETHSKSTLVKLRTILAQAFDFGIRRRHVSWNPARVAELPPRAEARALLNVASEHRLGAWVTVAMTLGLRPGEVSGLTWEAIYFDGGTLTVYQALAWPGGKPVLKPTKCKRSRTLELPAITMEALRKHRKRSAEERLMRGTDGRPDGGRCCSTPRMGHRSILPTFGVSSAGSPKMRESTACSTPTTCGTRRRR